MECCYRCLPISRSQQPRTRAGKEGPGDKEEDTAVMGLEWDQGQGSE